MQRFPHGGGHGTYDANPNAGNNNKPDPQQKPHRPHHLHLLLHDLRVNADRTEFIDDDSNFFFFEFLDHRSEQGRFSGTEESGKHNKMDQTVQAPPLPNGIYN